MKLELAVAAVGFRTAMKYRRDWNKNSPAVKALQALMPTGQAKKGYRLYVPIGKPHKTHFTIPPAVKHALTKAGFVATDYLAKKCVKITDKEQKNVFNIGKVIAKDTHAKMAFDNDPQLQNSSATSIQLVVSCHPYDIIGMSTGRDWDMTSCMRIDDGQLNRRGNGQYNRHVKDDVAEGTLVAYAINANDQNIQKPLCRCLVKPFLNDDEEVLYRRETRVYGNPVPGFDRALKSVILKLNADAKEGHYSLNPNLYNDSGDGSGRHHHHVHTDPNAVTFEDALDDTSMAEDYVRQQMEKVVEGEKKEKENPGTIADERRNSNAIVDYLRDAKGLKKSQLKAIAEMVKDSAFVKDVLTVDSLKMDVTANVGYVARKSGATAKLMQMNHDYLRSDNAVKFARTGNVSAFKQLEQVAGLEDDDQKADAAWIIDEILEGKIPVPGKEVLDEMPELRDLLHTVASAARYLPLMGLNIYQDATYEIMGHMDDNTPKKRGDSVVRTLSKTQHPELLMCYLLDNAPYTSADDWYEYQPAKAVYKLANRRAFRAFDKLEDGKAQRFMADIKMEILKILVTQPYQAVQFKSTFDSVREWLESDDDLVEAFSQELRDGWKLDYLIEFAKFSLKSFMHIYSESALFKSEVHVLLNKLLPILMAYEGPKLEPGNQDIEFMLRIAQCACKLMPHPTSIASKFEFEEISNAMLAEEYEQRTARSNRHMGAFNNLVSCVSKIGIGDTYADATNDMPLLVSLAPASLFTLPQESIVQNYRLILKEVAKLGSLENILTSLEYLADNLQPENAIDEDGYANENMEDPGIDAEHPEYEDIYVTNREAAREKAESINVRIVDRGAKCIQVLRHVIAFVGDPEEHDADDFSFGYTTPNITQEDIEQHMSDIEEKQEYMKEKLEEYEDLHNENMEQAGY